MASSSAGSSSPYRSDFGSVQRAEIDWINRRFGGIEQLVYPAQDDAGSQAGADAPSAAKTIRAVDIPVQGLGLAISGGGIRSAAFALGALQALDQDLARSNAPNGGLSRFHYLSTVSGGGYIGAAVRVGMEKTGGEFPFATQPGDKADSHAVGHIRNYSRYLVPHGLPDVIGSGAVVLRGLVANMAMAAAILLFLAGLTGMFNHNQQAYLLGDDGGSLVERFAYTQLALGAGLALLLVWAIVQSLRADQAEFKGPLYKAAVVWICATLAIAAMELQPLAVRGAFQVWSPLTSPTPTAREAEGPVTRLLGLAMLIAPYLAPLAAILAFFSRTLGETVRKASSKPSARPVIKAALAKLGSLVVALALPFLLWVAYVQLTLMTDIGFIHRPVGLAKLVSWACGAPDVSLLTPPPGSDSISSQELERACQAPNLIAPSFAAAGLGLFVLTWLFKPNANSLHRLYRDRLSKAFLFDPRNMDGLPPGQDPPECGTMALDDVTGDTGPLPLLNCALNVQASRQVNRRGRNADFFFFSPVFCGSSATGFVRTGSRPSPDFGSAIAISGAAASSNMGSNSLWGMAPTLALLNIRLGYWLDNPKHLEPGFQPTSWEKIRDGLGLYLVSEMFSQLDERAEQVYLTDGGHIENLGLYELLRRRVKVIVAIDAEADPGMSFGSFVALQRYARIDLGVRIELPWQAIAAATLKIDEAMANGRALPADLQNHRPHVAVGSIHYSDGEGRLIYVKASLTGDENDYVLDYKRRYPDFPHETTSDQFFSEEQFEAYRSLGFHAVHTAFEGRATISGLAGDAAARAKGLRDAVLS
ncbi:hypothetical protein [Alsobacter sp. SYSU BS001988]